MLSTSMPIPTCSIVPRAIGIVPASSNWDLGRCPCRASKPEHRRAERFLLAPAPNRMPPLSGMPALGVVYLSLVRFDAETVPDFSAPPVLLPVRVGTLRFDWGRLACRRLRAIRPAGHPGHAGARWQRPSSAMLSN